MRRIRACLGALLLALAAPALPAQTLTLHYQERPPYSSSSAHGVAGLVATPAVAALKRAGIDYRLAVTPSQRQLALIQSGHGLHCGVGWFWTPERAALGKFSGALYRDQPFGALVRAAAALPAQVSAASLLSNDRLRLLVKDGYSYGRTLDALIGQQPARVERTSVDPPQMSQMLRSGRADWMIVAPAEAAVLQGADLRLLVLDDVPDGEDRHLYCSRDVPDAWMARIDAALPPLPATSR